MAPSESPSSRFNDLLRTMRLSQPALPGGFLGTQVRVHHALLCSAQIVPAPGGLGTMLQIGTTLM